ncbi:1,6-anhydro-N-acetylmuramyl-L-alanine amidase AmpD [Acidovorax sp.]|uniref:1,6-anhydro-N-acetylmuramyl-L-alanine amidase AmpD n=1 Tax=Acidovorax sp. TaxID=1872122 RepID=UPI00391C8AE3
MKTSADAWEGGWHRRAHRLVSPNQGPRPGGDTAVVDLVVIHSISLPPGQYGTGAVQQLFTNMLDWDDHPYFQSIRGLQVSAHFFIDRGGVLWQFVDCDQRAWHAGQSHYRGRSQCNDDSVGIELEGLEGQHFEHAQYTTLIALCQDLAQRYPIRHIAGHEHIAPGRKQDPGAGFDWQHLQSTLGWPADRFPSSVLVRP